MADLPPGFKVREQSGLPAGFKVRETNEPDDFEALKAERQQEVLDEMSSLEKLLVGVGRGFMDVGEGVQQLVGADVSNVPGDLERYESLKEDSPVLSGVGRAVGNIAAAPVPGGMGANVATRLATAAGASGLNQSVMYTPEDESRLENVGKAALTGAIGQGVIGEPLRRIANKAANAKARNFDVPENAQKALDFADDAGVPLYADDVTESRGLKVLGDFTDDTPIIGTAGTRRRQGEAAQEAAEAFRDKFSPTAELDDLSDVVNVSLRNKLASNKAKAGKLYKSAFKELNEIGDFEMPGFRQAIREVRANEAELATLADAGLMREIQKLDGAPAGNFEHWHRIRSRLGNTIRDARKGDAVSTEATAGLEKIKRALDSELDGAASQVGGKAADSWKKADRFYAESVASFRRGALKQALNEDNPEKALQLLIGTGDGLGRDSKHVAQKLYGGLDKRGKETVRYAMMNKAMERATQDGKPFKPAQFARALEGMENRTGVFFNKRDRQILDGMQKYMRFAETAGHHLANQPTGRRVIPALALGVGYFEPTAGGTVVGANVLSRLMLRTRRGRDIMLALGSTTPESKAGADAISAATNYLTRALATERANPPAEAIDNTQE